MKRTLRWLASFGAIALVAVLGLAFAACGSSGSDSSAADTSEDEALHLEGDEHEAEAVGEVQDSGVADTGEEHVVHVEADEHEPAAHGDVQEITILSLDHFRYEPAQITVKMGQPVRITLDNSDGIILHDLTIEGLPATDVHTEGGFRDHGHGAAEDGETAMDMESALHVAVEPGGAGVLEFTPTEAGEYAFYCTVPGHQEAGMEGMSTVLAQ